jgi:23S rRNA (guanosine2251-2'-O)-methyltransferase
MLMKRGKLVNVGAVARARYVYGVHAVGAWLQACPAHVQSIDYDAHSGARVAAVVALARQHAIPLQSESPSLLSERARTPHHQGIVARTLPFPYAELVTVVDATPRLVIVVDHMQDPHNLGALLRTAEAAGAGAVAIPRDGSVPVTSTVEAAAAGAAARLPVCRIVNVARALGLLKARGYWTVGLVPRGGTDLFEWRAPRPLALVIVGETGVRRLVAHQCDVHVSIPMNGNTESLNASVAAAVVMFEVLRRSRVT